jgi:hypothetical protein
VTRHPLLVAFPIVWLLAFLAGESLAHGTPAYAAYMRAEVELAKLLGVVGRGRRRWPSTAGSTSAAAGSWWAA